MVILTLVQRKKLKGPDRLQLHPALVLRSSYIHL